MYSEVYDLKLSIITVCYNSEEEIGKTIESLLNQDYMGDVEYLIIDGASRDRTVMIAEGYRSQFKKKGYEYTILSEPDKGIYDAMNKGIIKSTGDIIGIINSGDWYETNALSTVVNTYKTTFFDYFYADINIIKSDGSIIVKKSKKDIIVSSRHWNHPTCFVKKSVYDELGVFRNVGIHDDFEFFLRVKKANKNIIIKNVVIANFVTGGISNTKGINKSFKRIKDRYRAYRQNGYNPIYIFECVGMELAKTLIN